MDLTSQVSTSSSASRNGININDALSILNARVKGGSETTPSESNRITEEMKGMGQTITITDQLEFTKSNAFNCQCAKNANTRIDCELDDDLSHKKMKEERAQRGLVIQSTLQAMNVADLLGTIFAAQTERVETYRTFDQGLFMILTSGNMTSYPSLCAQVTASFSVISDTINSAKLILSDKHERNEICTLVSQLQKWESEKLNLTAALHLEKLRLRNFEFDLIHENSNESGDEGTIQLFKNGIQTLEKSVFNKIQSINEVLEELQCLAADEDGNVD